MDIILSDHYLALIYIIRGYVAMSLPQCITVCIDICLHLNISEFAYQVLHIGL